MNGHGLLLILIGVPISVWPYKFARLDEQMDAIGSTRPVSEIEPATWKVALTRVGGIGMGVVGVLMTVAG